MVRELKKNPNTNKVIAVCVLVSGFILTSGSGLHAQKPPEPRSYSIDPSSDESISASHASSDHATVSPATTLAFAEQVKIYEWSFTRPESLIGPVLGAGIGQLRSTPFFSLRARTCSNFRSSPIRSALWSSATWGPTRRRSLKRPRD
jgi:hypothetical protein